MAAKRKRQRKPDVKRSPEIEDRVLAALARGESLDEACRGDDMPDESSVRWWVVNDPAFAERFTAARVCQVHGWFDKIAAELSRPIETDAEGKDAAKALSAEVQMRRLRVDTWKWGLSKLLPKIYGDKLTLANDPENPLDKMSRSDIHREALAIIADAKAREIEEREAARGNRLNGNGHHNGNGNGHGVNHN